MIKHIALFLITSRFSLAISQNLNGMAGFFQHYFSGTDNLRIVSVILLLLAFVLFLFLIVILYIKSLLSFIKNDVAPDVGVGGGSQSVASAAAAPVNERGYENAVTRETESVVQNQNRLALQQKRNQENLERRRRENAERELSEQRKREDEKKMPKNTDFGDRLLNPSVSSAFNNKPAFSYAAKQQNSTAYTGGRGNASSKEFDWSKGRSGELDEAAAGIKPFKYTPAKKSLADLTGLLINMMGRDIDEGKIAQVLKAKVGDLATEEEVIQLVDAVKNFIYLSINGKFDSVADPERQLTPDEALYQLSQGDPNSCMELVQRLLDVCSDKCFQVKVNSSKRDLSFLEASNYACLLGTLSSIQDITFSTSAFETAIELSPKNVNAWSRAADMYLRANSESKAIWAYQQVLNMADEDMYSHQVANANKHLSQFYYEQGDNRKAANLYNSSNDYYTTVGINEDLTSREQDIIEIIESKQDEDMPATINKLLSVVANRRSSQGM